MIYPQSCLEETIAAYSAFCSIEVIQGISGAREIEIALRPDGEQQLDVSRAAHEFLNYLLDVSLEHHLQKF
jgi:hypothetical protein